MMVRLPKDSQHVPQQSTADTKKQVRRIEKRHAWSGSRYPQGGAVTLYAVWGAVAVCSFLHAPEGKLRTAEQRITFSWNRAVEPSLRVHYRSEESVFSV